MTTYTITRFYVSDGLEDEVIATGVTLEKAQAHCKDPETSSATATAPEAVQRTVERGPWFDGYDEDPS